MTDANIEIKVIQIALILFAFIGVVLFSIRSGYWFFRRWQASKPADTAKQADQKPRISTLLNNMLGLAICGLLLFFLGNSA